MSEAQKPVTDDYREGWERIFGVELAHGIEQGRERFLERQQLLNPNDAHEHPPAD
jgi:DNA gyrase inhibitor GyrI